MVFSGVGLGSSATAFAPPKALNAANHPHTSRISLKFNWASVRRHRLPAFLSAALPHPRPMLASAQNYPTARLLASDIPRHASTSSRLSPIVASPLILVVAFDWEASLTAEVV